MRICLLSLTYPPTSTEGIPRQRHTLAQELVRLGHQVDVVTLGEQDRNRSEHGVSIHEVRRRRPLSFSSRYPDLDDALTQAQLLYEATRQVSANRPFDIIDAPLWAVQGLPTFLRQRPTVIWL